MSPRLRSLLIFCVWYCIGLLMLGFALSAFAAPPAGALKYRGMLTREAHFVDGLDAPIPMFAAQIEQESGWNPTITAWDGGQGLGQFMSGTVDTVRQLYPELGKGSPYEPAWAIRAMVRYDAWLLARVKGEDACQRRAAALKAYNAGLGYVQQAQRASPHPSVWFSITEHTPTRQSAKNFEYSRLYPRWVLLKRQKNYAGWGTYLCEGVQ